jgi:hypothetical protein
VTAVAAELAGASTAPPGAFDVQRAAAMHTSLRRAPRQRWRGRPSTHEVVVGTPRPGASPRLHQRG